MSGKPGWSTYEAEISLGIVLFSYRKWLTARQVAKVFQERKIAEAVKG